MEKVKFKKLSDEEIKTKKIILQASGIFDENNIKMLEIAMKRDMSVELTDEQAKFLEALQIIQERENVAELASNGGLEETTEHEEVAPEKKLEEVKEREEDVAKEPGEYEEGREEKNIEEADEEKEDEKKKEFVPEFIEEIENMSPEEVRKMYYLNGARMIETLRRMNNGRVWNNLRRAGSEGELVNAIENAYKSVIYPSELTNPDFLEKRIGDYLPESDQAVDLKGLHRSLLIGTYVGYHIEQNEAEVDDINEDKNVAIVKMPQLASELSDTFKLQVKSDLKKAIKENIEDIMNTPNSYKALMVLLPLEDTIDNAMQKYADGLHENEENKKVRAYISLIRKDMNNEIENGMNDLNVSLDLYGIDWNDSKERKDTIDLVRAVQGEGKEIDIEKFVKEIDMSFDINSASDIEAADRACLDLAKLTSQGIKVKITFNIAPDDVLDPEIQARLDEIVSRDDNIERNVSDELINNGVNVAFSQVLNMISLEAGMEVAKPLIQGDIARNAIQALSLGANVLEEVGRVLGIEEGERTRVNPGGGV